MLFDDQFLWVDSDKEFEYTFEGEYMEECMVIGHDDGRCTLYVNAAPINDQGSYDADVEVASGVYTVNPIIFEQAHEMTLDVAIDCDLDVMDNLNDIAYDLYEQMSSSLALDLEENMNEYLDEIG